MNGEEPTASTSRAPSLFPQTAAPKAAVKDYLVGAALDEALASGQDIVVSWPFADGDVSDWTQAEAIWWVCLNLLPHCSLTPGKETRTLFAAAAPARAERVANPLFHHTGPCARHI